MSDEETFFNDWRARLFKRSVKRTASPTREETVARFLCAYDGVNPDALIPDETGAGRSPAWHSFRADAAALLALL